MSGDTLIATSSGFDCVVAVDSASGDARWYWHASDHDELDALTGFRMARDPARARELVELGYRVTEVGDPASWGGFGLPTMVRAHLNEAHFAKAGHLLTFANLGMAATLDLERKTLTPLLLGLGAPHGFMECRDGTYIVSDTRRGACLFFRHASEEFSWLLFDIEDAASPTHRADQRWLQKTIPIGLDQFIAVDEQCSCLWIFDLAARTRRRINYPHVWRVHSLCLLPRT
jgi:hypothetical protein